MRKEFKYKIIRKLKSKLANNIERVTMVALFFNVVNY
jgi:hypothetical protein